MNVITNCGIYGSKHGDGIFMTFGPQWADKLQNVLLLVDEVTLHRYCMQILDGRIGRWVASKAEVTEFRMNMTPEQRAEFYRVSGWDDWRSDDD